MTQRPTTKKEVRELNGYRVLLVPDHPKAMKSKNWEGYVYEHTLVMEKAIKRRVQEDEVVHHLDKNKANNRIENLLLLSRGQHTKLHSWLTKGAPMAGANPKKGLYCVCCGQTLQAKQKLYCSVLCYAQGIRKTERPSKKQLQEDINALTWCAIGRKYGVSDNAIRKWTKQYGIKKDGRAHIFKEKE